MKLPISRFDKEITKFISNILDDSSESLSKDNRYLKLLSLDVFHVENNEDNQYYDLYRPDTQRIVIVTKHRLRNRNNEEEHKDYTNRYLIEFKVKDYDKLVVSLDYIWRTPLDTGRYMTLGIHKDYILDDALELFSSMVLMEVGGEFTEDFNIHDRTHLGMLLTTYLVDPDVKVGVIASLATYSLLKFFVKKEDKHYSLGMSNRVVTEMIFEELFLADEGGAIFKRDVTNLIGCTTVTALLEGVIFAAHLNQYFAFDDTIKSLDFFTL